ncbi:MAG: hypothetical protein IIY78_00885 [Clostridia bacterium]|nr:hypothetical protein [Clostridia bacterium]
MITRIAAALFVLFGLVAFGLASADVYSDVFTAEPDDGLPTEFVSAIIASNHYFLSEDKLNSYMAYRTDQAEKSNSSADVIVTDVYIDFNGETPTKIYAAVKFKGRRFVVAADSDISTDSTNIYMKLSNVTIGKLPVPNGMINNILKIAESIPGATVSDNTITMSKHLSIGAGESFELVSIDIIELSVTDTGLDITTEPIVQNSLTDAAGSLMDKFGELGDIFGDELGDVLGDIFNITK